jgi:hypothetical protein
VLSLFNLVPWTAELLGLLEELAVSLLNLVPRVSVRVTFMEPYVPSQASVVPWAYGSLGFESRLEDVEDRLSLGLDIVVLLFGSLLRYMWTGFD